MSTELTRRQLLALSALAAASFVPLSRAMALDVAASALIDVGEITKYAQPGIYPEFQPKGFFIISKDNRVYAQSAICTHKGCKLTARPDGFVCKCHNSTFDIDGRVTRAPAKRDLPRFAVKLDADRHLLVDLAHKLDSGAFDTPDAYVEIKA